MGATSEFNTTQSPSSLRPDLSLSKTTNISQSKTELTDSASHGVSSAVINGILFRMLLSYASFAIMVFSDERLNSAAGSRHAVAVSSQPSRVKELPPTDNPTTSFPAPAAAPSPLLQAEKLPALALPPADDWAASLLALVAARRGHEATGLCGDTSDFDIELDGQPRAGQVSPHIGVVFPPVILNISRPLQPPADADNTQSAAAHPTSSSGSSSTSASKDVRTARHEGVAKRDPISLMSPKQSATQPTQPHPVSRTYQDVLCSKQLHATGRNRGEERGMGSAILHGLPLSPEHTSAGTEYPSRDQPKPPLPLLDRNSSRLHGNESVDRDPKRVTETPTSYTRERGGSLAEDMGLSYSHGERRALAPPDEPIRTNNSAVPDKPSSLPGHATLATECLPLYKPQYRGLFPGSSDRHTEERQITQPGEPIHMNPSRVPLAPSSPLGYAALTKRSLLDESRTREPPKLSDRNSEERRIAQPVEPLAIRRSPSATPLRRSLPSGRTAPTRGSLLDESRAREPPRLSERHSEGRRIARPDEPLAICRSPSTSLRQPPPSGRAALTRGSLLDKSSTWEPPRSSERHTEERRIARPNEPIHRSSSTTPLQQSVPSDSAALTRELSLLDEPRTRERPRVSDRNSEDAEERQIARPDEPIRRSSSTTPLQRSVPSGSAALTRGRSLMDDPHTRERPRVSDRNSEERRIARPDEPIRRSSSTTPFQRSLPSGGALTRSRPDEPIRRSSSTTPLQRSLPSGGAALTRERPLLDKPRTREPPKVSDHNREERRIARPDEPIRRSPSTMSLLRSPPSGRAALTRECTLLDESHTREPPRLSDRRSVENSMRPINISTEPDLSTETTLQASGHISLRHLQCP